MPLSLEQLQLLERVLGKFQAAADWLGYTERQYYNIRRRLKSGLPLSPRLEEAIVRKIMALEEIKESLMTKNQKRLCRNIGKPEFTAARGKIKALLRAGYDRKFIHAKLLKEGAVTMSYSTFCNHFNKFKAEVEACQAGAQNSQAGQSGGRKPAIASPSLRPGGSPAVSGSSVPGRAAPNRAAKSEPFSIDRSRPVEELM